MVLEAVDGFAVLFPDTLEMGAYAGRETSEVALWMCAGKALVGFDQAQHIQKEGPYVGHGAQQAAWYERAVHGIEKYQAKDAALAMSGLEMRVGEMQVEGLERAWNEQGIALLEVYVQKLGYASGAKRRSRPLFQGIYARYQRRRSWHGGDRRAR